MTFESVEHDDEDEATVPEPADSWYDDAPITDEQIEAVRRDLDTPVAQRGAAFAPFVVRKLLAEIDRLNAVLDANRVVRNAAESSSRTYKGAMELLKKQRTELRNDLGQCQAQLAETSADGAQWQSRAETAERELAEVREQLQSARPSICDYCGMDRRVHDSRTWMAHCEATAGAHPEALKQMRARCTDASGWTATENAEFEELYGVRAAMRLRAANNRAWEVVKELRNAAVADGRNPYEDPMAQRLSAALIGEWKAADGG